MGAKKKRRQEEARIRKAMAALVASARKKGGIALEDNAGAESRAVSAEPATTQPRRTRGPQKAPTKQPVSIRLDRDVVEALRKGGRGWQTRLNAMLRNALSLDP